MTNKYVLEALRFTRDQISELRSKATDQTGPEIAAMKFLMARQAWLLARL